MRSHTFPKRTPSSTVLLLGAVALLLLSGETCNDNLLKNAPGVPEFQQLGIVGVPGGLVNVVGGNLSVYHTAFSLDTHLGEISMRTVYNSTTGRWRWTFEMSYDGSQFVDTTGAVYDVTGLSPGDTIPGTPWVVVDSDTIKSKGGLVYDFDASGRWTALSRISASHPRIQLLQALVDGETEIVSMEQCIDPGNCTELFGISYANGDVVAIDDLAGRRAEYTWGAGGNLRVARSGFDFANGLPGTLYTYVYPALLISQATADGEQFDYTYIENGRKLVSALSHGPGNPTHGIQYFPSDEEGLYRSEVTDPTGAKAVYRYDATRHVRQIIEETGEISSFEWSGNRVSRVVAPNGSEATFTIVDDDVVLAVLPTGNTITNIYQPDAENRTHPSFRPLLVSTDSVGLVEQRVYDTSGRLVTWKNGLQEPTTFTYDSSNLLETRTSAAGVVTTYQDYGPHGYPMQVDYGGRLTSFEYDAVGNLLRREGVPDRFPESGGVVARSYDENRRVSELQLASLDPSTGNATVATIEFERRSDGRPKEVRRPHGGDTFYTYDAMGRLVSRCTIADGSCEPSTVEYDLASRPTAFERPNGMRMERSYDAAGRMQSVAFLRNGVVEKTADIVYDDGLLREVHDSSYATPEILERDSAYRVTAVDFPGGERIEYDYDLRSRILEARYLMDDGSLLRSLEKTHDLADRPLRLIDGGAVIIDRTYEGGRLEDETFGNGVTRSYSYDSLTGQIEGTTSVDATSATIEEASIDWSGCSLSGGLCPSATVSTFGPAGSTTFEAYELLRPTAPPEATQAGVRMGRYSADPSGAAYSEFAYDELSNLLWTTENSYVYNAEHNRLLEVRDDQGALVEDYVYDSAGMVVSRGGTSIERDASGRVTAVGSETAFAWDTQGRPVYRRVDGDETSFLFGGRVETSMTGTPLELDLGEVGLRLDSPDRLYRHLDFRGNVSFVTDASGGVVSHLHHEPYGIRTVSGAPLDDRTFAQGRSLDGLVLIGPRLLDSLAARFMSPDWILDEVNEYSYTKGNPVWFWDPTGLQAASVGGPNMGLGSYSGGYTSQYFSGNELTAEVQAEAAASGAIQGLSIVSAFSPYGVVGGLVTAIKAKGFASTAKAVWWAIRYAITGGRIAKAAADSAKRGSDDDDDSGSDSDGPKTPSPLRSRPGSGPGGDPNDTPIDPGNFGGMGMACYLAPTQGPLDIATRQMVLLLPLGLLLGWRVRVHARRGGRSQP